jgi:hypothetical protein
LGGANVQTTPGAQKYSTQKIDMDSRNILANKCPTPVRAHRCPLGHVVLKIVKRQKKYPEDNLPI